MLCQQYDDIGSPSPLLFRVFVQLSYCVAIFERRVCLRLCQYMLSAGFAVFTRIMCNTSTLFSEKTRNNAITAVVLRSIVAYISQSKDPSFCASPLTALHARIALKQECQQSPRTKSER